MSRLSRSSKGIRPPSQSACGESSTSIRRRPGAARKKLPYSTSKAAVIAFARSCAQPFAPDVRVNCLAPGLIKTDMSAAMDETMHVATFLKRTGKPEEIAETVLYLLSERSNFVTGQTLAPTAAR